MCMYMYISAEAKDALAKAQMFQPLPVHTDFPIQTLNSFLCINIQVSHQTRGNDGTLWAVVVQFDGIKIISEAVFAVQAGSLYHTDWERDMVLH